MTNNCNPPQHAKKTPIPCIFQFTPSLPNIPRAQPDLPPPLRPLNPTPKPDPLIQNKIPQHTHPTAVARQVLVELAGRIVQRVQPRPRHGGEVVVLVVEADVVGQDVQGAVVGVGLVWLGGCREGGGGCVGGRGALLRGGELRRRQRRALEDVVLGDEMAGAGVQAPREEGAEDEVAKCAAAHGLDDCVVEGYLRGDVEEVQLRDGELVDEHGAEGVEDYLEGAEEGLPQDGVEEYGFEGGWEIGVEAVDAEGLVVGEMVWLDVSVSWTDEMIASSGKTHSKRSAVWYPDG